MFIIFFNLKSMKKIYTSIYNNKTPKRIKFKKYKDKEYQL